MGMDAYNFFPQFYRGDNFYYDLLFASLYT